MLLVRTHPVARGIKIGSNAPPVWQSVPTPSFVQGVASNFPPVGTYQSNGYVTDADGGTPTVTWVSGSVSGVTWDGGRFVYDGTGSVATTGGLVLRANDGADMVDSSAFSITIESGLTWSGTPSISFVEASVTPTNLGAYVTNYNALTDEFRVTPSFSLPAWLTLTAGPGSGSGNLTPNGSQVDADDVDAGTNPIKIDVRRSGGAWVSSTAFGVTVTAAPVVTGSIDDFAFEGIWTQTPAWVDPQKGNVGNPLHGKHTAFQYCPWDQKIYGFGGDGVYPGEPAQSGSINFSRFTLNGGGTNVTYDQYYLHYGQAGVPYPVGADQCPWVWDASRNCFWTVGGFSWWPWSGGAPIGVAAQSGGPYLWRFFVQTGQWELVRSDIANYPTFATGLIYHAAYDCLIWPRYSDTRFGYYNCTTGAMGLFHVGLAINATPFSGPFPGVTYNPADPSVSDPRSDITANTCVYDAETNEIIWRCMDIGAPRDYNCIFATSLTNFPNNCTSRQIKRGVFDGVGDIPLGQAPMVIRGSGANRKLYFWQFPWGYSINPQNNPTGAGLGFYELNLTTAELKQASQPYFINTSPLLTDGPQPSFGFNEGTYSPAADRLFSTSQYDTQGGGRAGIFRWTPPSWTPAAGAVLRISTNIFGASANNFTYADGVVPFPPSTPTNDATIPYVGGKGMFAYSGGCYARDLSTNGCLLRHGGGDGDYWGNEIYAFDFDTRKWYRISNPSTAMTGTTNFTVDYTKPTNDPKYFNQDECEHGPDPTVTAGWTSSTTGMLPLGTQPGVPHVYSGIQWVPGQWMGNRRGALVRPFSTFVYATRGTMRAHYFDLDRHANPSYYNGQQWGRLSTNGGAPGAGLLPNCALDNATGRLFHNWGYLDLTSRTHVFQDWGWRAQYEGSSAIDSTRQLWFVVSSFGWWAKDVSTPLAAGFTPTFTGDPAPTSKLRYAAVEYCPPLGCFFFYNPRESAGDAQTIWKITPPASNYSVNPWTVQQIALTAGDTPPICAGGLYNNFRWVPPLKCFAWHAADGYVYLYKPAGV